MILDSQNEHTKEYKRVLKLWIARLHRLEAIVYSNLTPAKLVHWVQIMVSHWFNNQFVMEEYAASPDYGTIFPKIIYRRDWDVFILQKYLLRIGQGGTATPAAKPTQGQFTKGRQRVANYSYLEQHLKIYRQKDSPKGCLRQSQRKGKAHPF